MVGASVVAVVDVELGRVAAKFTHPGEDFYAVATSAAHFAAAGAAVPAFLISIHGCAGKLGSIKVFDASQLV